MQTELKLFLTTGLSFYIPTYFEGIFKNAKLTTNPAFSKMKYYITF